MKRKIFYLVTVWIACQVLFAEETQKGKTLFKSCSSCHGTRGEGNQKVNSPAIAGLPEWYIIDQLIKFKEGIRGAHPDDIGGLQMRPMARMLHTQDDIKAVATYISLLKPVTTKATVQGNAEAGKVNYGVCIACHGKDGKGNKALHSPPIVQMDDWYIKRQLENFKKGIRGAHKKDIYGGQMRPMALTLTTEQILKNVVAYIQTLSPKEK